MKIGFLGVVLQLIADDFPGEIGCGDQTLGAAVLVHHQQQGLAVADQRQQFSKSPRLQNANHRLQIGLQSRLRLELTTGDRFSQFTQIQDTSHVVEGLTDHGEAGMAGAVHRFHQLSEDHIDRQRDHPGARDHHLPDLGVPQSEHTLEDVAFIGEQTGDTPGVHEGFELTGRERRQQHIPLGCEAHQTQGQCRQRLQHTEQRGKGAHRGLEQGPQTQRRRFRTVKHPGLRQQACHQGGHQHQHHEQAEIKPHGTGAAVWPELLSEAPPGPAEGHKRQHHAELRHQQSPPQPPLQTMHGHRSGRLLLHQDFHPAGAQPKQSHLSG